MEHDAWMGDEVPGSEPARDRYQYFMRPEPKEDMGPIERIEDPVTGREMRVRNVLIGMVRNAKTEDKNWVRAYLDPLPHIRLERGKDLQGWYQSKHDPAGRKRPRPCFTDAVLTEPYGGYCTVGCAFCYINSGFRGYRGSGLITVPMDYGAHVAKQLDTMKVSAAGYFSSFTDPFLPLEDYYGNTRAGAQAFVDRGLPVFFLSRLAYPSWAFDLLRRSPYSYAQKSLNTSDPEDWRKLSPGALPLDDHIEEVRALRRAGIYTSIQINPILPGVTTNEEIVALFERLAEVGNNHVIVKFVEAGYSWAPAMVERVRKRFGHNRGGAFESLFTDNIGGQRTVSEEYRLEAHRIFRDAATRLGMTYATCYEYAYERDAAGEITSKRGRSIGRDFLTADQCHGHKVPMHIRVGDRFQPMGACPPSGCLTCADDNSGKARCGSDLLGEAKALRLSDFRNPGL